MPSKKNDYHPMLPLLRDFINANNRNKRLLKGGKKLSTGTKKNYEHLHKLLTGFEQTGFELRFRRLTNSKRIFEQEKRYYKKFYLKFTEFLFEDMNAFDNYVGHNIKLVRTFFKWVVQERGIYIGEFYKNFHVWKEDIPIVVLQPEQLNYLITNEDFTKSLSPSLRRTKDVFVLGCTVALRVSDLLTLKKENIESFNGTSYLKVISRKTNTYTKIKLPAYATEILSRNKIRGARLFKSTCQRNFNQNIKRVVELAGWTYEFPKMRTKRGIPHVQYKDSKKRSHYRFCDLVSTHTMRRTAITTMLNLGVEEQTVRKISGHAPGSVEFYKYVKYNQQKVDEQTDEMFEKLAQKTLVLA
ncbi:MAG: tyrosine-type recombinase/integrase [Bacteroidia bacterium]|nr:tyrosine-type recombinase/integrase [Bacteroidia bacterium]